MSKKALETYTVMAKMTVTTSIDIRAESLQDAVTKASELDVGDFIDVVKGGDLIDIVDFNIEGAYK